MQEPYLMPKDAKTVFNLPQNPLALKSFKYTYIKTRVEKTRA